MSLFNTYQQYDVSFTKGVGSKLYDTLGNQYLDFASSIGVTNLGHCHPEVIDALNQQASQLWSVSNIYMNQLQLNVAQQLSQISGLDSVFFTNSGAESNEAAIKLARKWAAEEKGIANPEILTFQNSFHGRTLATLTATGQEKVKTGYAPLPSGFKTIPTMNMEAVKQFTHDDTAAIMLELVQGEGGVRIADPNFVKALSAWCRENRILLIVDEVQTGMGRTGKWFCFQHYGITPDIVTLAKGLGNGFPVGAMMARSHLHHVFGPGTHGTTFGGNHLAMAVVNAVLSALSPLIIGNHITIKGDHFAQLLKKRLKHHRSIHAIRHLGLMIAVELNEPVQPFIQALLQKGMVALPAGNHVLRLLPPLIVTSKELETATTWIDEVFSI
ncbi:aspartate aminotransferase family protein [Hazenella sp. IB182357]|uniref:Aspartate aminotransferase family protein n=1 Tax=Polycladospora coralii TaxID=2771432 RepID=A0A926N9A3_9BACL|nr:aspartate aminotransferase family protein [Polycladospora coralii]MBD1372531.1 aspartate aminotransferase family protein [Polycladospora coralii]MBS7531346.1 aspartate aminotransferase family protein [Polycladospora coralii]